MFKVDPRSLVPMPAQLAGGSGVSLHTFVEATNNLPVWILQVLAPAQGEGEIDRWRRFFVSDVRAALALSDLNPWLARNLYVLLPGYMTGTQGMSSRLCLAVWDCEEPDGNATCWRIETEQGVVLDSMLGTEPGQERKLQQAWVASGLDDGRTCFARGF